MAWSARSLPAGKHAKTEKRIVAGSPEPTLGWRIGKTSLVKMVPTSDDYK